MQYKTLDEIAFINPDSIKKDYPHSEIEYIDISSVGTGHLIETKPMLLSEASSRAKRLVKDKDTILSTVRPNRRSFLFVKKPKENIVVSTGFAVLRAKNDTDPRYLYYAITDQKFTDYLALSAKGAAYPAVDTEIVQRGKVPYWSSDVQKKISVVLSAYDDLIENNTRRIKIHEEMCQRIYREWFVDFRFPGHKKARFVNSELGKTPEGWEVKNLFDVAEVTYGYPFKSSKFTEEDKGTPVIRIRDISTGLSRTFTEEQAEHKYLVTNGDILVGMDGDFHMCRWAGGTSYLNQRVARFRPLNNLAPYYLYWALKKDVDIFDETIVGTTVAHLGDQHLKTIRVLVPDKTIMNKAEAVFNPLYDLEINLFKKNQRLIRSRDVLLPKLISGEIDVAEKDIAIQEQENGA